MNKAWVYHRTWGIGFLLWLVSVGSGVVWHVHATESPEAAILATLPQPTSDSPTAQAPAREPQSSEAYGLLGDAAVERGNYREAFAYYQKMLHVRPDLSSSYHRVARLLDLAGDTRRAMWMMQKAIAAGAPSAEDTARYRAQLALMLWGTGAFIPAEQVLVKALEYTPTNYHVLFAMGKVKTARKDYAAAIAYYQRAIANHHEKNLRDN